MIFLFNIAIRIECACKVNLQTHCCHDCCSYMQAWCDSTGEPALWDNTFYKLSENEFQLVFCSYCDH